MFNRVLTTVLAVSKAEAVFRRCSVKKMFLEISQNLQENTCVRVSFFMQLQPATLLKKKLGTGVFL